MYIVFTHVYQFTFYFITLCTVCTKSYAFTLLCSCVYGHLHINFTSRISLQKPILLTYPLICCQRCVARSIESYKELYSSCFYSRNYSPGFLGVSKHYSKETEINHGCARASDSCAIENTGKANSNIMVVH